MRYMLLIYGDERARQALSPEEKSRAMAQASRRGIFRGAEPLELTSTATTVRMQNGKALITDGPFAETKEQLAGYYILDCKDLDEALEWAAKISTRGCGMGCVEVRPIVDMQARIE